MKLGFLIYGSLDTLSGGYMYDRKLVDYLRKQGDTVEIIVLLDHRRRIETKRSVAVAPRRHNLHRTGNSTS